MNKLIKITLTSIFIFIASISLAPNVFAHEDLVFTQDGTVISGDPVIEVFGILPGDETETEIKVENVGEITRYVSMKGELQEETKNFSEILEIEIFENGTLFYGGDSTPKTLEDFFLDSENGLPLFTLSPGEDKTFRVKVKFPSSAGNEYQNARVVFSLSFGLISSNNIVINEVYSDVDENHGSEGSSDKEVNAEISGNAAGSTNIIDINIRNTCVVVQRNNADIDNSVDGDSNTGDNESSNNTNSTSGIFTGSSNVFVRIRNFFNFNFFIGGCSEVPGASDEWVELFNPTDHEVDLKDWSFEDNSGQRTIIHSRRILEPEEFALVSKAASTWRFWDENSDALKIPLGQEFGDGLDNVGDHLILYDENDNEVDYTAWGTDTEIWNPAPTSPSEGNSLERLSPGFDNDLPGDWNEQIPPTPGE